MNINSLTNAVSAASTGSAAVPGPAAAQVPAASAQTPAAPPAATPAEHVASIISSLQALAGSVEFTVDKAAGKEVITIRDPKSGEVIRQLPSEEALKFARQMASGQGGLINQSA
jgi:flagellar protein FlaG